MARGALGAADGPGGVSVIGTFWKNRITGVVTVILRDSVLNWIVLYGNRSARRVAKRDFASRYEPIGKVRK